MSRNVYVVRAAMSLSLLVASVTGCSSKSSRPMLVTVMPATVELAVGGTKQLQALGFTSDGATAGNISAQAIWSSTDTSVATVNSDGVVTAKAAGKSTVSATVDGVSGTSAVTVTGSAKPADMATDVPPEDMSHDDGG